MKTKSILSNHAVMLPVIFLAFAGYFFAVSKGNGNLASNYSLLILAGNCVYSENPIFGGKLPESRPLQLLAHMDGFLLSVWFVILIAQLFL